MPLMDDIHGLLMPRVVYSLNATQNTDKRIFKKSKRRSKRVYKKLIKRHNGYEFFQKPAILKSGEMYIAHPAFRIDIERAMNQG